MTGKLIVYGIEIAVLFGLAGLALERIAAWRGVARRGAWAATLVLSVAFPVITILAPPGAAPLRIASVVTAIPWSEQNRVPGPTLAGENERAPVALAESGRHQHVSWPTVASLDRVLRTLWMAASIGMVMFYALLWLRLGMAARRWRRQRIGGQEVWVTEALGPAVYGFFRPIILMPHWVLDGPDASLAVVLAHEQEHAAARDPLLLMLGLLLVTLVPWNLPLWWQLRRLRFAIEVDCDARVLSRGIKSRTYGEILLTVGQHRSRAPIGAIALNEPASQLLRRIRIIRSNLPKRGKWAVGAAIGCSLVCVAVAAQLSGPTLQSAAAPEVRSTDPLLKPPLVEDPRAAVIQRVVRSTYPELFRSSAAPGWVAITLLMNPDGTVYKGYKDDTQPYPYITNTRKAFDAMGVDYDQHHGDRVQLDMQGGAAGATSIYVRTFFLKPVGASSPEHGQAEQEGPAAPNDDPAVNRAIAEKYFPDLYTYTTPKNEDIADFWVLLDHEGKVRATGRRYAGSRGDLKLFLESLYPGIRTDGFQPTELRSDHGRPAVVNFMWLAADSPVTDLSKADLSKRSDVALYAEISGEGSTSETTLIDLKFGSSAVAVCDRKDLDLQVTAADGGADSVILRARIQQVARVQPPDFKFGTLNAVETAWSPETSPIRVRYGESAEVQVTDQDHKTWKVVFHPDRMQGTTR